MWFGQVSVKFSSWPMMFYISGRFCGRFQTAGEADKQALGRPTPPKVISKVRCGTGRATVKSEAWVALGRKRSQKDRLCQLEAGTGAPTYQPSQTIGCHSLRLPLKSKNSETTVVGGGGGNIRNPKTPKPQWFRSFGIPAFARPICLHQTSASGTAHNSEASRCRSLWI